MSSPATAAAPATSNAVNPRLVWATAAVMLATLVAGLINDRAAVGLFILGVAATLYLVRWAFPSMWLYSLWLAAVYALAFIGALVFALTASARSPLVGPVPLFAAMVAAVEALSLFIGLALFAEIKSIRDFRTRLSIARGDDPPEYTRIGLWTLALVAFFAVANLSALFLVAWVRGAPTLFVHAALEGLLIGLAVFVLYVPEAAFGNLPSEYKDVARREDRQPLLVRVIAARVSARSSTPPAKVAVAASKCPVCEGPLTFEQRRCPSCASVTRVGWCPKSEVHVVKCEHCGKAVVYGKPVCPHCKGELKEAVACESCEVHSPLRDWSPAPA